MEELQKAFDALYAKVEDLQDVIDSVDGDVVPTEHYVSLKDDVADLIVLLLSGSNTDKMVNFLLQTYFTSNERENILKEAEMVEAVRYEN